MSSKEKIKFVDDCVSWCLKNLSKYDEKVLENPLYRENMQNETMPLESVIIILITTYLTRYPLFNGEVSELEWYAPNAKYYFTDKNGHNKIFNEEGNIYLKSVINHYFEKYTFPEYDMKSTLNYDFSKIDKKIDFKATDFHLLNDVEKFKKDNIDFDGNEFFNVMKLVSNKLKEGEAINPQILYQYIRNGFAHFNWNLLDEGNGLYVFHFNDSQKIKDLEVDVDINTLYEIVHEYVEIMNQIYQEKYLFIETLMKQETNETIEKLKDNDIFKKIQSAIKDTEYYDDFAKKIDEVIKQTHYNDFDYFKNSRIKFVEYILKNGKMSQEDREHLNFLVKSDYFSETSKEQFDFGDLEIQLENYNEVVTNFSKENPDIIMDNSYDFYSQYDATYIVIEYIKKYLKDKYVSKEQAINLMTSSIDLSKQLLDNDEIELIVDPTVYIKALLNALFVQVDYSNLDLSSINFESIKYLDDYKQLIYRKINNINQSMDNTLNGYLKKYYEAKVLEARGLTKGLVQLNQVQNKLDDYSDLVYREYKNIDLNYKKINESTKEKDNSTIITSIRNALAHGYITINLNADMMSSDIIIKDYDKRGNYTFGASFKLYDLLNNMLKHEIKYQLDPQLPALVR